MQLSIAVKGLKKNLPSHPFARLKMHDPLVEALKYWQGMSD